MTYDGRPMVLVRKSPIYHPARTRRLPLVRLAALDDRQPKPIVAAQPRRWAWRDVVLVAGLPGALWGSAEAVTRIARWLLS